MKKTLTYFLTFFLLAAFLFSSFPVSINKMRCLESGNISYSLLEAEDCCPPEENSRTYMDVQCCEFSKITFQSGISEILKQEFFKKISFTNFFSNYQIIKLSNYQIISFPVFSDTSPPPSVGNFLSLISIFRI